MTAQGEPRECPFCGGPPMLHSYHEAVGAAGMNRIYWVTCDQTRPNHCQAAVGVPVSNRQSEAEAIAAWNRRPEHASPPVEAVEAARRIVAFDDGDPSPPSRLRQDAAIVARALLAMVEHE